MDISKIIDIYPFCSGVSTDSRSVCAGNIFFALRGESFDGNLFARQALEKGAICAVIERESEFGDAVLKALKNPKYGIPADKERLKKYLLVEDPLKCYQELAKWHRSQFKIPVLALTGTNGKTTTKELIKAVLSKRFRVLATQGNLNNSIGVPKTLFELNSSHEIVVIEMGASHPGDIKELVDIALPNFGLITNVGKAHLLGFGSFDGVKATKGELYDHLDTNGGTVFLNSEDQILSKMVDERANLKTITYGLHTQHVEVLPISDKNPYLTFKFGETVVRTHLIGGYNITNALAAICVGEHFGVVIEDALRAIAEYIPTNNRSELRECGSNLLIVDAYNANPTSMEASLKNFSDSSFQAPHENKVLILGDMRELGEYSHQEHCRILEMVLDMEYDKAILVGEEFGAIKNMVSESIVDDKVLFFKDVEILKEFLQECPITHSTILIKGSNGIRLQSILDKF